MMTDTIEIRMGTGRKVLLVGGHAVKIARTDRTEWQRKGFEDNLREAACWNGADAATRQVLCPVEFSTESGDILVMPRAQPIPEAEWPSVRDHLLQRFSDLYRPGRGINCEIKPETCGYLNGEPVIIDYGDES